MVCCGEGAFVFAGVPP